MQDMAQSMAEELFDRMEEQGVCEIGRLDIVARLVIEHTRLLEGGLGLRQVFDRATEMARQGVN